MVLRFWLRTKNYEPLTERKEVKNMTRKLILVVFLALVLILPSQLLAGERPSPGPTIAKVGAVASDCGCLKKDKAPTSTRLRPDVVIDKTDPMAMDIDRGDCRYAYVCVRYCNIWPWCGPVYYGHCLQWRWMWTCDGRGTPHWQ